MNRNRRHMRYRQSVYRRHSIKTGLIVGIVVLIVLLLLFLILGNILFDKVQEEPSTPDPSLSTTTPEPSPYPFESVRHVKAPLLSLDESSSTVLQRLEALAADGQTAVSLPLTDNNGTLLYHSEQASNGNFSNRGNASLSLADLAESANADGIYLCGAYSLTAASEEDALTRSVLLSESAAVLAEAFLAGMDDVVIIVPTLPTERQAEIIRFAESIRALAPKAIIGLSLPEAEIASADATRMDTLAKSFDYLALDLSGYGDEDPIAFAEARMQSMLYYLLRYEMRVLLPSLADENTRNALIEAVEKESIDNRMLVLPRP